MTDKFKKLEYVEGKNTLADYMPLPDEPMPDPVNRLKDVLTICRRTVQEVDLNDRLVVALGQVSAEIDIEVDKIDKDNASGEGMRKVPVVGLPPDALKSIIEQTKDSAETMRYLLGMVVGMSHQLDEARADLALCEAELIALQEGKPLWENPASE